MGSSLKDLEISFLILYGSQTGQAESIAHNIADEAASQDLVTEVLSLNEIKDITDLCDLTYPVVIVTSTTGDGDPPENADKFWRKIRKRTLKSNLFASLAYSLLGLGDTNYNNFCNCGKQIHKRLQELGATTFYDPAWADDAVGLELVIEDWIDGLWPKLKQKLGKTENTDIQEKELLDMDDKPKLTLPPCPPISLEMEYKNFAVQEVDLENPIMPYPLTEGIPVSANVHGVRCLSKPGSVKTTLEVQLKFNQVKFAFEPGDAFGIVCPNDKREVEQILKILGVLGNSEKPVTLQVKDKAKGKVPAFLPPGCTLRQIFAHYLDIRMCPKKNFLRLLAEFTEEESEKQELLMLSSRQGAKDFESKIRNSAFSLLDILLTYSSCRPPVEALVEHLPRLIPRAYSITTSPLKSTEFFKFAFNIINFSSEDGRKYSRRGVCTGWLLEIARNFFPESLTDDVDALLNKLETMTIENDVVISKTVVVYKRKNHNFRLPEDLSVPVIMVGPGTGVSPFIGFIEHRSCQRNNVESNFGVMHLYFGCRNQKLDYLYEEELSNFQKDGVLTKLYSSFSRDQDNAGIRYVQHYMEKNKEELAKILLEENGALYVCGDARNMAKNVRETLVKIIQVVKGIPENEATNTINELITNKKYLQDVWA